MSAVVTPGAAAAEPAPSSRGYWASVGVRVLRDPVFWVAASIVLALLAMALFGPWIAPADPRATRWAPTSSAATCSAA
jgi:peptide/nickel transport system permease protein